MSRFTAARLNVTWPGLLLTSNVVIPVLFAILPPHRSFPAFTPRQLIDDHDLVPLLFAPWSGPTNLSSTLSRVLQIFALVSYSAPISAFYQNAYSTWICIASARGLAGWVLTRCVGWAAPLFFKHWSLYESSSGFGAILYVMHILQSTGTLSSPQQLPLSLPGFGFGKYGQIPISLVFGATLCYLEDAPWTYGISLLCGFALVLVHRMLVLFLPKIVAPSNRIPLNPRNWDDPEMALNREMSAFEQPPAPILGIRDVLFIGILSLALLEAPYAILSPIFKSMSPTPMPHSPSPSIPLLEILMLTFPRSDVNTSTAIMQTTIESYIPLLNDNIHLSVFTHATEHPAFNTMKKLYSENATFYQDQDTHPDAWSGHYLHLAEAFRWVSDPRPNRHEAEWVMLIEDDFPICAGEVGKDALRKVLAILESSRPPPDDSTLHPLPRRRAGFIGTGGSGLIIHRTMLPILQAILRLHAEKHSKLPEGLQQRPPDVVMQDCILGRDPLCPIARDELCLNQESKPATCGMVITSRLVMDHIGGMFSTTRGKMKNSDKWRCGWRHAFHGAKGVEVVVVDW